MEKNHNYTNTKIFWKKKNLKIFLGFNMILEHLNINYCKYVKMLYLKYIFKKNIHFFKINYMEEELKAIVLLYYVVLKEQKL